MLKSIDHIVIAVRDLAQASADYASAGFTVTPGGEHTGGVTHNALISFSDGTYFELIALKAPARAAEHHWFAGIERGEGSVAFALLSDDLDHEGDRLSQSGIETEGPRDGGRLRPDGQSVEWRSLGLESVAAPLLPFLIQDRTPRVLRVPDGAATQHPLGASGVAGVTIAVGDLRAAASEYSLLLDPGVETAGTGIEGVKATRRFSVGNQWIDLAQPGDEETEIGTFQYERGDTLFQITLAGGSSSRPELPIDTTHGVHIGFGSSES